MWGGESGVRLSPQDVQGKGGSRLLSLEKGLHSQVSRSQGASRAANTLSGSIFSFLESTDLPYSGPLLSDSPHPGCVARGAKHLESAPRPADKECSL